MILPNLRSKEFISSTRLANVHSLRDTVQDPRSERRRLWCRVHVLQRREPVSANAASGLVHRWEDRDMADGASANFSADLEALSLLARTTQCPRV